MFCTNCGNQVDDSCKFCSKCGQQIIFETQEKATVVEPIKKKSGKGKKIIIWTLVAALALSLFANIGLPFIVNNPMAVKAKLSDTSWYTEPMSFVSIETGENFDAASSIEFLDDGTAIMTEYICYGSKGKYTEVKIIEEKTVSWSVEKLSVLKLDDTEYSFNFIKNQDASNSWYLEDDKLDIGVFPAAKNYRHYSGGKRRIAYCRLARNSAVNYDLHKAGQKQVGYDLAHHHDW